MHELWRHAEWIIYGLIAAVIALIGAMPLLRIRLRALRFSQFARVHGYRFDRAPPRALARWPNHQCLDIGEGPQAMNLIEGTRGGRTFAMFDYHCRIDSGPGGEPAHPRGVHQFLPGPVASAVGHVTSHGFSAVVVECHVPGGVRTASAKRGFAPWHVDTGPESSVAWSNGLESPRELAAVLDELNAALDLLVRDAPPSAAA